MRTALVTGGAGFIGGALCDVLHDAGFHVAVIDDFRTAPDDEETFRRAHPWAEVNASAVCEVWLPPVARAPDVIFHLAGPVGPVGVLRHAGRIVPDVVDMAETVAGWATMYDVPLVYVSTSEVYGGELGSCAETQPRVIAAGHSARMEYAVAKLAAETMLLNRDIDVRIVRPFNVAGPRQSPVGGFVTPRFVRQALAGDPLTVYMPGSQLRAFTHVLDEAEGMLLVAEKGEPGGVYNVGNPANRTTLLDYADLVIDTLGSASRIDIVDPVDLWGPDFREAPDKYPDNADRMLALGWDPRRDLRAIIGDTAAALR